MTRSHSSIACLRHAVATLMLLSIALLCLVEPFQNSSWNDVGTLRGGEDEAIRESLLRAENLPHHIT